jgi:hypothetical protein
MEGLAGRLLTGFRHLRGSCEGLLIFKILLTRRAYRVSSFFFGSFVLSYCPIVSSTEEKVAIIISPCYDPKFAIDEMEIAMISI